MRKKVKEKANEINEIQILDGRDYRWVWDYAQFRFSQTSSDVYKAEEKAGSLLKFVIYGFGAFWALFVYFIAEHHITPAAAFNGHIVLGLLCLCVSAALGIYCLVPTRKLLLYGEEVAIRFINACEGTSPEAQGRFGLGLKLCSDFQEQAATRKSLCVLFGFIFLVASFGLLFSGFYSWMLLPQSYGRQIGTALLGWL
jgi:hypothetical protein